MDAQMELQQKLSHVASKLKLVCEAYQKLKKKIKAKDEQITRLKLQVIRLEEAHQMKQNCQVQQIRQKYEMESSFRASQKRAIPRLTQPYEQKNLKYSKSLSPQTFSKILKQPKQTVIFGIQKKQPVSKNESSISCEVGRQKQLINMIPSVIDLKSNKNNKHYIESIQISEIDKKYGKESKQERVQESQAEILKQLWEERDREIRRMDSLFESINKKIYGDD